jgi:hypothetical protein
MGRSPVEHPSSRRRRRPRDPISVVYATCDTSSEHDGIGTTPSRRTSNSFAASNAAPRATCQRPRTSYRITATTAPSLFSATKLRRR